MTTTPQMPAGISHFAIKVRDLAAAERFYCGVLGLAVQRRWPHRAAGTGGMQDGRAPGGAPDSDRSLWLSSGDGAGTFLALEIVPGELPTASVPAVDTERGGHHLLALRITREQRAGFESRLAAAGVPVSHRTAFTIYFRDPEGNRLGLSHYPDPVPEPLREASPPAAPLPGSAGST